MRYFRVITSQCETTRHKDQLSPQSNRRECFSSSEHLVFEYLDFETLQLFYEAFVSLCEADITSQLTNQLNLSPWTWPTPANSPTRFMTSLVISCIPIFFHVICLCFSWVQIYIPIFLCLLSLSLHRLIW